MDENRKDEVPGKLGGFFTPANLSDDRLPTDGQEFELPSRFNNQDQNHD
jgi:hypothetical protein